MAKDVAEVGINISAQNDTNAAFSRLRTDLESAAQGFEKLRNTMASLQNEATRTQTGMNLLKGAILAMGVELSVSYFKNLVTGAIESTAQLKRLSEETGATGSSLSALAAIGKMSGTSLDTITAGMNKLSKGLAGADEDSRGAAAAIKALGLNFDEFTSLSPDQRMLAVAKAMDQFKDGSDKTAAAMMLFGKSGAELLPMMHDLADVNELVGKRTNEQIKMAEEYERNMRKVKASSEAWKGQLAMGLLPAMNELSGSLLHVMNGTDGVGAQIKKLAADGTLANWARGAVTAFTYLIDVGQALFSLIPMIGHVIAGVAASFTTWFEHIYEAFLRLKDGDVKGAVSSLEAGLDGVKTVAVSTGQSISEIWNQRLLGERIREGMEQAANAHQTEEKAQKQLRISVKETAQVQESEYQKVMQAINQKIAMSKAELAATTPLNDADKMRVQLLENGIDKTKKLTQAEREAISNKLNEYDATLKQIEAKKQADEWSKEMTRTSEATIKSLNDQIATQEAQNEQIGLTKQEVAELVYKKQMLSAANDEEYAANLRANAQYAGDLHDAYLQYAHDLEVAAQKKRELAELKLDGANTQAMIDQAKAVADEWKRTADDINQALSKAIMKGFTGTKGFITDFMAQLKGLFAKLVLQPILAPVSASIASMIVPNAAQAQGASGLGNLMSVGSSLFSNGFSFSAIGSSIGTGLMTSIGNLGASMGSEFLMSVASGIGGGAVTGVGTALGAGIGALSTAMPYIGAAMLLYKGLSMGEKQMTGQTVSGSFGDNGLSASRNVSWTQSGGFLRGSRSGTWSYDLSNSTAIQDGKSYQDSASLQADQALKKQLESAYNSIKASTKAYADALGINAGVITDRADAINFAFGKDQAETTANITKAMQGIAETMAGDLLKGLDGLQREGESSSATLTRLVSSLKSTDAVLQAMGKSGVEVFGQMGAASLAARQRLIDLSGGIDALNSKTSFYVQNFLTEAERLAPTIKDVSDQMQGLGLSNVTTVEAFKGVVQSLDLSTEAGAKMYATLMDLAPAFKAVVDFNQKAVQPIQDVVKETDKYTAATDAAASPVVRLSNSMDEMSSAADKAAQVLSERQNLQDQLDNATMTSAQLLEKQRNAIDKSNQALFDQVQAAVADKAAKEQLTKTNDAIVQQIEQLRNANLSISAQRAKELEGLDASTVALKMQYFALQDQAAAASDAQKALQSASSAIDGLMNGILATGKAAQQMADSLKAARDQMLTGSESGLGGAQKLAIAKAAMEGADPKDLPALTKNYLTLLSQNTTTLEEYQAGFGAAMGRIDDAQAKAQMQADDAPRAAAAAGQMMADAQKQMAEVAAWNSKYSAYADLSAANAYKQDPQVNSQLEKMRADVFSDPYYLKTYGSIDGSHADGLDYVPFDGYVAQLHKGERVLTASEAQSSDQVAAEIRQLRIELQAQNLAIAKNTADTSRILNRWNSDGQPEVRSWVAG